MPTASSLPPPRHPAPRPVLGPDSTYTIVTDLTAGEAHIDQAIRTGNTNSSRAIAMAAPHLLERPVTGHLIIAVLALIAGDQQSAETHAQAAADNAAPLRCEAITIHLRGLGGARPEHHEAITRLIEIFAHANHVLTEMRRHPGQHPEPVPGYGMPRRPSDCRLRPPRREANRWP